MIFIKKRKLFIFIKLFTNTTDFTKLLPIIKDHILLKLIFTISTSSQLPSQESHHSGIVSLDRAFILGTKVRSGGLVDFRSGYFVI